MHDFGHKKILPKGIGKITQHKKRTLTPRRDQRTYNASGLAPTFFSLFNLTDPMAALKIYLLYDSTLSPACTVPYAKFRRKSQEKFFRFFFALVRAEKLRLKMPASGRETRPANFARKRSKFRIAGKLTSLQICDTIEKNILIAEGKAFGKRYSLL